jgi:uncharacterized membrane protein YkoI
MRLPIIFAVSLAVVLALGLAATLSVRTVLGDENPDGRLEEGSELAAEATVSVEDAIAVAQTAATGPVGDVELDRSGDILAYEIEIGESDVYVDAQTGELLSAEQDDRDDDDADPALGEPSISVEQAVAAAQAATSGTVGEVELESELGRLVYSVEIGNQEVVVDATDGSVLSTEQDD